MNTLLHELKRRNIFRVAGVYAVVGWILAQIASLAANSFGAPGWVMKMIIVALAIGFPIALLLAWAFEMTPEGVKRTEAVEESASISTRTGRVLDMVIVAGLVLVAGLVVWQGMRSSTSILRQAQDEGIRQAQNGGKQLAQDEAGVNTRALTSATLAVLPFRNLGDAGSSGFTDGLHDDLLTQLSRINALRVISRTSVMGYRDTSKNMHTIGRELGATHIMEGGIQRAGNRVRINVQLIDVSTDEHVWAETYDRALTVEEIFNVQSDIARAITTAMRARLTPNEAAAIATAPTDDLVAYEAYLQSRARLGGMGAKVLDQLNAIIRFKQIAVVRDPDFAEAWAELAENYSDLFWFHGDVSGADVAQRIIANVERLKGPDHYLAKRSKGIYLYHGRRKLRAALPYLDAAISQRPNDARSNAYMGFIERRLGDFDSSTTHLKVALQIDPMFFPAEATLGQNYIWRGDWPAFENLVQTQFLKPLKSKFQQQLKLIEIYTQVSGNDDALMRLALANHVDGAQKKFDTLLWFFKGRAATVYPLFDRVIAEVEADLGALEKRGQNIVGGRERLQTILLSSAIHARSLGDRVRMNAMLERIKKLGLGDDPGALNGESPWLLYELKIMQLAVSGQGGAARKAARALEAKVEASEDGIAAAQTYMHLAQAGVLSGDVEMVLRYVKKGAEISPAYNTVAAIMKLSDYDAIRDNVKIMALVKKYAPDFNAADAVFSKYIAPEYFYGPAQTIP